MNFVNSEKSKEIKPVNAANICLNNDIINVIGNVIIVDIAVFIFSVYADTGVCGNNFCNSALASANNLSKSILIANCNFAVKSAISLFKSAILSVLSIFESSLLADINKKISDLFTKQKENTTNITNYNKQISDANAELDKLKLDTNIDNTLKIADLNKLIADLTAKLQLAINMDFDKLLADAKAELQKLLPQTPVSAYTEKIKTAISTIITFPITFIMSLFKQMLAALTGLISFDFSEFTKFIEMMKPSIDSVTLFISTFMDTFVSGFSKLYKAR
jgi:hypothetical protein